MTYHYKSAGYIIIFVIISITETFSQTFSEVDIGSLPKNFETMTLWVDVDNDGDSDLVIGGAGTFQTAIYKNTGGTLSFYTNTNLPSLLHPIFGAADFNKDGFVDLVLTGVVSGGDTRPIMGGGVYLNNGSGSFTKLASASLITLSRGTVDCGDFDLDGDVDILMTGSDKSLLARTVIMANNGDGSFSELPHPLPGVRGTFGSGGSWGDYDRDGDLDILLSGEKYAANETAPITKIFVNNGDHTFTESPISLLQFNGKSEWVDVNADGWLDVFVSGYQKFEFTVFSKLYINQSGSFADGASITDNYPFFDFSWADFDNDGDKDMLSRSGVMSVYINNGGTSFTKNTGTTFPHHSQFSVVDFEGDGDFDILFAGTTTPFTPSILAFRNNSTQANTVPTPPSNLVSAVLGGKVSLTWGGATDLENASTSLEYVLRVGTSPGTSDVVSPLATTSGKNLGLSTINGYLGTQSSLNNLSTGTYYATVQAIDQNAHVSLPSNTAVFTIANPSHPPATPSHFTLAVTSTNFIELQWIDHSFNESAFSIERSEDGISFQELATVPKNVMRYVDKTVLPDKKYFYRTRARNINGDSNYTAIQSIINPKGIFKKLEGFEIPENEVNHAVSADWIDYNNDGFDDLFMATSGLPNLLYQNKGDGSFEQISTGNHITGGVQNRRSCWADYDNDGDMDVFIPTSFKGRLFNNTNGFFTEVTGVPFDAGTADTYGISWVDYDNDGFLDLSVLYYRSPSNLFHNNGDGTFSKVTEGLFVQSTGDFASIAWCDYNNDGWQDALAVNYAGTLILYKNNKGISFEHVTDPIVNSFSGAVTASWADYDNDGDFDAFIGHNANASDDFFRNNGDGSFTKVFNEISLSNFQATSSSWGDIDNDGNIDLFLVSDNEKAIFFNKGDGSFRVHKDEPSLSESGYPQGIALGDYEKDGFLDVAIPTVYQANVVLKNNGNDNHWISFHLQGTSTNRNAIGAKVSVITGPKKSTNYVASQTGSSSQNSFNVEFGLGGSTTVDSVVVEWPQRGHQTMTHVAANQFMTLVEPTFPAAPLLTLVKFDINTQQVQVVWNEEPTAIKYIIERSVGNRNAFQRVKLQNNTLLEHSEDMPVELDSVFYRVLALAGDNASWYSNIKGTMCGLRSPENVSALVKGSGVNISWNDVSARENQYQVNRSMDGITFQPIVNVSVNLTQHLDAHVIEQITHHYTVRAVNEPVMSRFSDTVTVVTPLKAPDNLALSFGGDAVTLHWRDNSQKETAYIVERSEENNEQFAVIGEVNANTVEFNDVTFDLSTHLFYRVRATNAAGESDYSEEVTAIVTGTEVQPGNLIAVYPNPSKTTVSVKTRSGAKHFSVVNAVGVEVLSQDSTDEITILDLIHLPEGIYIINTIIGGNSMSRKVSVAR
jgi:hypothetical protein